MAKTPPPTRNLTKAKTPAPITERRATVVQINDDGRAMVDIAGSTYNLTVPGSVLGVKAQRTVLVRIQGNSRTIVSVVSPVPAPTYTGTTAVRRGATTAPPTISTNDPTNAFADNISGLDLGSISGEIRSALQAVSNRYANINNNFDSIVDAYTDLRSRYITTRNQVVQLRNANAELREKFETLIADLRERGLLK